MRDYQPPHKLTAIERAEAILERKPGALRHGAPFQDWELPESIKMVRDRLLKQPKGDKTFVDVLLMAKDAGLEAMETACALTLETGIINASVVINELRRLSISSTLNDLFAAI